MKKRFKKSRRINVAQFDTDSRVVAARFKSYLDENRIAYTSIVTWTEEQGLIGVSFRIFGSRVAKLDLLAKFLEEESK